MNSTGALAGQFPPGDLGTPFAQSTKYPDALVNENRPACFVRSLSNRAVIWKPCQAFAGSDTLTVIVTGWPGIYVLPVEKAAATDPPAMALIGPPFKDPV